MKILDTDVLIYSKALINMLNLVNSLESDAISLTSTNDCILPNRVAKSLSDGLHQRPYNIVNSLLQVTSGVMASPCGKLCPMENGLTGICPIRM